ncbi:MAG: hypothetical protein QM689_04865 [Oscillospiraceae bacterium]
MGILMNLTKKEKSSASVKNDENGIKVLLKCCLMPENKKKFIFLLIETFVILVLMVVLCFAIVYRANHPHKQAEHSVFLPSHSRNFTAEWDQEFDHLTQ